MIVIHFNKIYSKPVPDGAFIRVFTELVKGGNEIEAIEFSETQEIMKRFSREDHADLQRKKDGWKGKALRLIGFLNNKDEVIKRLLRENKHYRNTMTEGGL